MHQSKHAPKTNFLMGRIFVNTSTTCSFVGMYCGFMTSTYIKLSRYMFLYTKLLGLQLLWCYLGHHNIQTHLDGNFLLQNSPVALDLASTLSKTSNSCSKIHQSRLTVCSAFTFLLLSFFLHSIYYSYHNIPSLLTREIYTLFIQTCLQIQQLSHTCSFFRIIISSTNKTPSTNP